MATQIAQANDTSTESVSRATEFTLLEDDGKNRLQLHNTDRVFYIRLFKPFKSQEEPFTYTFTDNGKHEITITSTHPVFEHTELTGRLLNLIHSNNGEDAYVEKTNGGDIPVFQPINPISKASFAIVNLTKAHGKHITIIHQGKKTTRDCNIKKNKVACTVDDPREHTSFNVEFTRELIDESTSQMVFSERDLLAVSITNYNIDNVYYQTEDNTFQRLGPTRNPIKYFRTDYSFINQENYAPCSRYDRTQQECREPSPFKILLPSIRTNIYDNNHYYRDTAHYVESKQPILLAANVLILPKGTPGARWPLSFCPYGDYDSKVREAVDPFGEESLATLEGATSFQWNRDNDESIYYKGTDDCPYDRDGWSGVLNLKRIKNENGIFPNGGVFDLEYTKRLSDERYKDDTNYKDSE